MHPISTFVSLSLTLTNVIAINYSLLLSTRHTIFNFVVSPQYFSYGYPLKTSLRLNMQLAYLNNGMCTRSMA